MRKAKANLRQGLLLAVLIALCTISHGRASSGTHLITQDGRTVWHHDCSNTTGFTRMDEWNGLPYITYGNMTSSGNYISFDDVNDTEGMHGPVFVHEFNESFQLSQLEEFSTRFSTSSGNGQDRGRLRIYLLDKMYEPVLFTYFVDSAYSSPFDIHYSYGNRFYPLDSPYEEQYKGEYRSPSMSLDATFSFTMGDGELLSKVKGDGSTICDDLRDLDRGRSIQYLVIEYLQYDISTMLDYNFKIYDIYLRYNDHTVEPDESLEYYYTIPREYLWYGDELHPDDGYSSRMLNEQETHLYYGVLDAGVWNVSTTHESWLDVRIDVVMNNGTISSANGSGDFPSINFTLSEKAHVLINVTENSPDGDSFGYYDITLSEIPAETGPTDVTTTTDDSDSQDPFSWAMDFTYLLLGPILAVAVLSFVILVARDRLRDTKSVDETFDVPMKDVPREYRQESETSQDAIRILRLPVECPHCSAPLKQEGIQWVGPAQAECPYCNRVVNAELDEL